MDLYLAGQQQPLGVTLAQRINDRMLHRIVDSPDRAGLGIIFHQGGDEIPSILPAILVSRWDGSSEPTVREGVCELRIRDVLAPRREHPYGESDIDAMLDAISSEQSTVSVLAGRNWLSQRDVIDVIESLIEHPGPWGQSVEVCGRRCWNPSDIFAELSMLWRRYEHGSSATFDIDDLSVKPPLTSAGVGEGPEPDHSGLHRLLGDVNGVGWKPLTPMRIALMELLTEWMN